MGQLRQSTPAIRKLCGLFLYIRGQAQQNGLTKMVSSFGIPIISFSTSTDMKKSECFFLHPHQICEMTKMYHLIHSHSKKLFPEFISKNLLQKTHSKTYHPRFSKNEILFFYFLQNLHKYFKLYFL